MPSARVILAALAAAAVAATMVGADPVYQGFNYGATFNDGSIKAQSDFEAEFAAAAKLAGTDGAFTSARLYTMIQAGTDNQPSSAIQAAINTKTSVLLGLWASSGDAAFANELVALRAAIAQFSGKGLSLAGISVGSEDLYRISPTGIANKEFAGADPATLVSYIGQVRAAIKGTDFDVAVGHVDTWTSWVNATNDPVLSAIDWVGVDAYAYYEDTKDNSIADGAALFDEAVDATRAAVEGKPIWITETGWPVSGKDFGKAQASTENAKRFWDEVGCDKLFGQVNTWWFTLQDAKPATPNPSFGVVGDDVNGAPLFDLSCSSKQAHNSSSSSSSSSSAHESHSASSSYSFPYHTLTIGVGANGTYQYSATSSAGSSPSGSPTPISGGGASNQTYVKGTPTPIQTETPVPTSGPTPPMASQTVVHAAAHTVVSSITAMVGVAALAVVFAAGLA